MDMSGYHELKCTEECPFPHTEKNVREFVFVAMTEVMCPQVVELPALSQQVCTCIFN